MTPNERNPKMKITLPYSHMVLVHDKCGGRVDPIEQYYNWWVEGVDEHQYCHGCECYLTNVGVELKPRRAVARNPEDGGAA